MSHHPQQNTYTALVIGHTTDIQAVIIKAATSGQCSLEIQYRPTDTVSDVMARIKRQIQRYPLDNWALAHEGETVSPNEKMAALRGHANNLGVVFHMLHATQIATFNSDMTNLRAWKQLLPHLSAYLPDAPRMQVAARYNLINPVESPLWLLYMENRDKAEAIMNDLYQGVIFRSTFLTASSGGQSLDIFMHEWQRCVSRAVQYDLPKIWKEVADGVALTCCDVTIRNTQGAPPQMAACKIAARIHATSTPSSVDVFFTYTHAPMRNEWRYALTVRVNAAPRAPALAAPVGFLPNDIASLASLVADANGVPRSVQRELSYTVYDVHTALFGTRPHDVDPIITMQLVLASVGIRLAPGGIPKGGLYELAAGVDALEIEKACKKVKRKFGYSKA